jgi:chorismate dehydratase
MRMKLGAVSFLNARPLIEGLSADPRFELIFDVPARLPGRLDRGEVDVALVPILDVLGSRGRFRVASDACIGCDGETMTVRVFSQVPPNRIRRLHVDSASHTSVALAAVLWPELFGHPLMVQTIDPQSESASEFESVLLIGDKVVDNERGQWAYEMDLGGAWRQHTGLPFVFAVWATPNSQWRTASRELSVAAGADPVNRQSLFDILNSSRDRGVTRAAAIAREQGPAHGWPVELAIRYLTHRLKYRIDSRMIEGANRFAAMCTRAGLAPADATISWPDGFAVAGAAR